MGPSAFSDKNLTNIILPNTLTTFDGSSFSKNNFNSITLPVNTDNPSAIWTHEYIVGTVEEFQSGTRQNRCI